MSAGALEQVFANPLAANPNLFQQSLSNVTALRNFQARQAIANAYQQTINPQTGAVDQGRFNALMAGPQASWAAPAAMAAQGQAEEAQARGASADLGVRLQQMNVLSGLVTPLLLRGEQYDPSKPVSADNQPVTTDDLNNVVTTAQSGGWLSPQQADWARSQINRPGVNALDIARGWWFTNQSAREQLGAGLADTVTVPNPAGGPPLMMSKYEAMRRGLWAPPFTGAGGGGAGGAQGGQNPFDAAQSDRFLEAVTGPESGNRNIPAAVPGPGGAPATGGGYWQITQPNWAKYGPQVGIDLKQYPTPMSTGDSPAGRALQKAVAQAVLADQGPGAWTAYREGKVPGFSPESGGAGAGGAPVRTASAAAASTGVPGQPGGGVISGVSPGMAAEIPRGTAAYGQAEQMASTLGNRIAPLENALSTLRANPDMQTGPGQAEVNDLKVIYDNIAKNLGLPQVDLNNVNAFQETSKYLAQYLRGMPGANRSDLAQLEASAASPHPEQSRPAMQALLAKAVGYERLQSAGYDYFNSQYPNTQAAVGDSGRYNIAVAHWMGQQDPVAYAVDEMTRQEYKDYWNGLSPAAQARFHASRLEAVKLYPDLRPPPPGATR
jgi:hypothetical protein